MKNKQLHSYFGITISAILAAAIFCLPYQQAFGAGRIEKSVPAHVNKKPDNREHRMDNLERQIRKAYNIPDSAEIYISTNPPPVARSIGDVIPAGTTAYEFSSPTPGPMFPVAIAAVIIVIMVVIVVAGVIIYVVYKIAKMLDKIPPPPNPGLASALSVVPIGDVHADGTYREVSVGMSMTQITPDFDYNIATSNAIKNLTIIGEDTSVDARLNGVISFDIQSSTDLFNWHDEYRIVNTLVEGAATVVVYNNVGTPVLTNSSVEKVFDGQNMITAPKTVTGCLVRDQAIDAQKFWRMR